MTAHDRGGCRGDRMRRCPCALDRYGALDAAVDDARARPWVSPAEAAAS
jgi:hypothetical protein